MLQRIQSLWLLLAAACAFSTLKFSTYTGTNNNSVAPSFLTGTSTIGLMAATLAAGIVSLLIIFLYKTRKLQLRLIIVAILLELLVISLYYKEIQTYVGKGAVSLTSLLHAGIIVFLVMAAKGISSDEKLIRDSNRLR